MILLYKKHQNIILYGLYEDSVYDIQNAASGLFQLSYFLIDFKMSWHTCKTMCCAQDLVTKFKDQDNRDHSKLIVSCYFTGKKNVF